MVKALKDIEGLNKRLQIRLVGKVDDTVKKSIEKNNLTEYVEYVGMVSHSDAIKFQLMPVLYQSCQLQIATQL